MPNETISVPEIHCGHCKASIEGALSPLEGVETATVDIESRTVAVDYDESAITRDDLVAAIVEQGYDVPA